MIEPMTPTEMRAILDRLGWSQGDCAAYVMRDTARIRKMARGANPIPDPIADWLRRCDAAFAPFAAVRDNPPPARRQHAGPDDHLPAAGPAPPG